MVCKRDEKIAQYIYDTLMEDMYLFYPGRRNDDAVDLSIACHILGLDSKEKVIDLSSIEPWNKINLNVALSHIDRVASYLPTWGPPGNEEFALRYLIRPYNDCPYWNERSETDE